MKSAISYLFVSLNYFPNISPHIFRIKIVFKTKCHLVSNLRAQLVKNLPTMQENPVDSWVRKIPWRRERLPTPVFLPGESQGQGSLVGCRLWGCTESDMTKATLQQQQQHVNSDVNFLVEITYSV